MQANPPMKTIEGDLFDAFCKAGAISKDNSVDPKKVGFMRAARTDKGVHAAGNVVSLKLIVEDEGIVEKINTYLPDTVRLWGYQLTNKSFECRKMCSSRVYEYLIPSFSFLPPKPTSAFAQKLKQVDKQVPGVMARDPEGEEFWKKVDQQLKEEGIDRNEIEKTGLVDEEYSPMEEVNKAKANASANGNVSIMDSIKKIKSIENKARRNYRISSERLEKVREAFKLYEGTHNFHNFTLGKNFKDASAKRVMKSLTVSEGKIINGTEWLSIKIHGQSFMLHQIRKMVAMVALCIRYGTPLERITEAFNSTRISIPKAPSLGLLLEEPVYDGFNKKLEEFGRNPLSFDPYREQMEAFKMKHIYDKIYSEELKENVYTGFFGYIDTRADDIFDFLTARGIQAGEVKKVQLTEEDKEELKGDNEG